MAQHAGDGRLADAALSVRDGCDHAHPFPLIFIVCRRRPRGHIAASLGCVVGGGARQPVFERRRREIRKGGVGSPPDRRRGSRYAASARRAAGLGPRPAGRHARGDHLGDLAERGDAAGDGVQRAATAAQDHARRQIGDVVDQDVVAPLLALSEQLDWAAGFGQAAETVRAVAVMRIIGAVDQCRAQSGEGRLGGGLFQQDLAGQMHDRRAGWSAPGRRPRSAGRRCRRTPRPSRCSEGMRPAAPSAPRPGSRSGECCRPASTRFFTGAIAEAATTASLLHAAILARRSAAPSASRSTSARVIRATSAPSRRRAGRRPRRR